MRRVHLCLVCSLLFVACGDAPTSKVPFGWGPSLGDDPALTAGGSSGTSDDPIEAICNKAEECKMLEGSKKKCASDLDNLKQAYAYIPDKVAFGACVAGLTCDQLRQTASDEIGNLIVQCAGVSIPGASSVRTTQPAN